MATTNPLFKFGVDIEGIDGEKKTALHRAAMFSDQDKVAWLLDEGLELEAKDAAGSSPLHCAVFYMQRAVIKLLLSRGADIGTRDNQGFTPLHTAASHSSFQAHLVLVDLLESGAEVEAVDNEGRTPLLLALEGNRKEAIDVLLAAGACTDVADRQGRSALHLAVGCSSKMVEKLLALEVTIDARDSEGRTPLHYAAHKGVKATALVLLKAGADLGATDKLGRHALDIAEAGAHSKLADFLKQWVPVHTQAAQDKACAAQDVGSPVQTASCPEAGAQPADGIQTPMGGSPHGLGNGAGHGGQAADDSTLFLERSISRAQKIQLDSLQRQLQELQSVIAERNSLQQHLAEVTAQKEAEIRQLHEDRAALQASLRASEESQGAMRARLLDMEKRASEAVQLRIENAELASQLSAQRAELAAREAAAPQLDALQQEIDSLLRRNNDLEERLQSEQDDRHSEAAAHTGALETQQARIRILQEANEALVAAAAAARKPRSGSPAPLGQAIQGAMSALQGLPILKDRNRVSAANAKTGVQKPSLTGQQGDGQNENTAPTDSGARSRASPGRPTVRRVGGGYAHSPSPSSRTSPAATAAAAAAVATAHCDGATKGSLTVAAGKETEHENTAHPRMPSAPNQASCDLALEVHLSNAMETMSIQSSDEALDDCDAALRSEPQAREAARPGAAREAHHRFVPQVLKVGGTSARQELVLGSPSTRASTPQSRTQLWLKDQARTVDGSAWDTAQQSGTKQRLPSASAHKEASSRPWASLRDRIGPSSASKAHKSLIDRFNSPGGAGR